MTYQDIKKHPHVDTMKFFRMPWKCLITPRDDLNQQEFEVLNVNTVIRSMNQ
jgi:hypothetical protein